MICQEQLPHVVLVLTSVNEDLIHKMWLMSSKSNEKVVLGKIDVK